MTNLIGQNLGPYRIIEQIGRGGMATVYKAYQPSMDRYVAVKILPAHFMQDPTFVERFQREARTIAKLEHPHILPVFDYGQAENGVTYIAMRYVEAGTLADLLRQKMPPLRDAFRLFDQMADALAYAHEQGVIHRDIKPSNMLVDARNQVFLTDFGLARMMEGTSNLTGSMIMGTPAYMAPELGEGRPADPLSDIYALGVVLYEMTTGRQPFEAETPMAVMLKHMTEPLPLPRQINPDIPEALEQVILKALAKEPADRFQSITAMLEAVRHLPRPETPSTVAGVTLQKPQPPPASPAPAPTPAPQPAASGKKFPAWGRWAIAGVVAVALIAVLIGLLAQSGDDETPPEPSPGTVVAAVPPTDTPPPADTPPPPTAEAASPAPTEAPAIAPTEVPAIAPADVPPGWTLFSSTDDVTALALQGDVLWVGTTGGLVAWDYRNFTYQKFTIADGMPYQNITALAVADDGALWAGTDSAGVLRFDGQTWQQFTDADGLASDSILTLFKSNAGVMLAGSAYGESGLNYFVQDTWEPGTIPPELIEFPSPIAIAQTSADEWIVALADGGGLLYSEDGENWARLTTEDGLPSNNLVSLALGEDDSLWLSTDERGGVGLYDGETFYPIDELADYLVTSLYFSPDGVMWLGTADQVLLAFDGERLESFDDADGLPDGTITRILQDDEGILWLGTDGSGLVRFERDRPGRKFDMWQVADEPAVEQAQQIIETADGRLWFVPRWGGDKIAVFDPRANAWDTVITPNEEDAYALAIEPDGAMWFGTENGLWRITPEGAKKHFTTDDGLPGNAITALAFDGAGGLWVGTESGLVYHNPADTDVPWRDYSGALAANYVEMLYVDPAGEVWVGTNNPEANGAAQLLWAADTIYGTWGVGNPFADTVETIEAAAMDSAGRLWVGTWGGPDVYRLDEKSQDAGWQTFSAEDGGPEGEILSMAAQPDGPVWFGTWYHGLWRFDADGWRHVTPADGAPGLAVFAMHAASDGSVWVSTEGGLGRFKAE